MNITVNLPLKQKDNRCLEIGYVYILQNNKTQLNKIQNLTTFNSFVLSDSYPLTVPRLTVLAPVSLHALSNPSQKQL